LPEGARTLSEHRGEEIKGQPKETIGKVTGDKILQRKDKVDQARAETKKTVEKAADKVKNVITPKP
jgi:uncharacterized protein YjbJ (UPF0337 family)